VSEPKPLVVLDASAVLAWVLNEPGAATVDQVIPFAVVTSANLTEVLYRAARCGHRMDPATLHHHLLHAGISVEPVTDADTVRAADLIAQSRQDPPTGSRGLALGDGLCLAVAERLELPVTGGDQLWETLDLTVPYHPFR
jgi:PIN domain nuclease of toxin-antitoxin system